MAEVEKPSKFNALFYVEQIDLSSLVLLDGGLRSFLQPATTHFVPIFYTLSPRPPVPTSHHAGNVKYRSLVKKYQPLYIMSKRRDKPLIASKIVRLVRHSGGRFLRKDKNNTWR